MKKEIKGTRANYIVEDINDIGDYRISISGHEVYKHQSWMVGNFDYMSSINRIENDEFMLLDKRQF